MTELEELLNAINNQITVIKAQQYILDLKIKDLLENYEKLTINKECLRN